MSFNWLQIRERLSLVGRATLHRQVFILAGDESWQKDALEEILAGYEADSLWVADQEHNPIIQESQIAELPFISIKKAHSWLGNEKKIVVYDATTNFDPDSFAAISGIVIGGGLFILLMPEYNKWNTVYSTLFGQRLINSINTTAELTVIKQGEEGFNCPSNLVVTQPMQNISAPFLTVDQQNAVETTEEHVLQHSKEPVVLISDRGRGKSAALGLVAARLLNAGIKNIVITAPRLRATNVIFKHIENSLPEAELTRGCVKLGDSSVQFYAPDQLMLDDIDADVLLVDEAAGIPIPLLTAFLNNYTQCVFSTTVHGYEGTGRGFTLRFNKILNETTPGWIKLQMETPIRWPVNDPLEKWMFRLLCLDAEIADIGPIAESKRTDIRSELLESKDLDLRLIEKDTFLKNQELLNEVFSLLVLAHYRTRPNDLKTLLDDEDLSVYVTSYENHVVAVALVVCEGMFSESLSQKVYRGERRPSGNLLAQALTYHCGIEQAATLDYARVMRIAVHPLLQQQGIGSALLDFIVSNERDRGRDAIGTSFGMNKGLLDFWRRSNFDVVRIGFTREQTSGEHAAIMILPLTKQGAEVSKEAIARFNRQLPFWFDDVLKDIPLDIKTSFITETVQVPDSNQCDKQDLLSFIKYSRNYELCIAAINNLVLVNFGEIDNVEFPDNYRKVLYNKIIKKMHWKDIGVLMDLSGKNEARKLFQHAIIHLVDCLKE